MLPGMSLGGAFFKRMIYTGGHLEYRGPLTCLVACRRWGDNAWAGGHSRWPLRGLGDCLLSTASWRTCSIGIDGTRPYVVGAWHLL